MNQFAKIKLSGTIRLQSGLHIGGSSAFSAIGAVDSPVIKDPLTNLPMIPGSSLKGKMRSLLASAYNENIAQNPNKDQPRITRLFTHSVCLPEWAKRSSQKNGRIGSDFRYP